jgi:anti-sigma factor RsiW
MTTGCLRVRKQLGAYADGELRGREMLLVARHVSGCEACAEQLDELHAVGDAVRAVSATHVAHPDELAGLAAGVVSRTRAEASQSWGAVLRNAVEDWHWPLTLAGSLCAAVLSVLAVSAICVLGPDGERADSLAAMLNNLDAPEGTLYVVATPVGRGEVPMLMQFARAGAATPLEAPLVLPAGFSGPSRDDLALALAETVVRPDGRVNDFRTMSRVERRHTMTILDEMRRLRAVPLAAWSGRHVNVERMGFVTNTRVRAKAL